MDSEIEPMDQDGDDTLQVRLTNDLFKTNDNEDVLDFEEADDLEITDFPKTNEELAKELDGEKISVDKNHTDGPVETIKISVVPDDDGDESTREDGEISETHSLSGASDVDDNSNVQYFSRSSSTRSSRRRNDIRRERSPVARRYPNPYLEFDDAKIQSRALRFGTANSSAAGGSGVEPISDLSEDDLVNLYISCGLIQDDGGKLTLEKVSASHRIDSILIRGTNHMNTNEIFKYLYDLGHKPIAMEWVNDAMCVVIFSDKYQAAAALLKISKPILMDPRMLERKRSIIQTDNEKDKEDSEEKADNSMSEDFDYDKVDAIPQSWITVPMPPGYVWRLGAPCEKAKGILIRFANKQDKKQERAERFSEFYKNYGNPNKLGNNRDNSNGENKRRRKKFRPENNSSSMDSQKEDYSSRNAQEKIVNPNDKNGWSQLSALWDDEEAFQRSARDRFSTARQRNKDKTEVADSGISPMKKPETTKEISSSKTVDAREILKTRQKRKRGTNSSDEEGAIDTDDDNDDDNDDDDDRIDINDRKDSGSFRRKRGNRNDDAGDNIQWRERLSGPRMRMHADEEEERQKRRAFRRLGQKRSGDSSLQTNFWDFSRDSSNNNSFRSKTSGRRPVAERLGAKRNPPRNNVDPDDLSGDGLPSYSGFDLRQKLINMRRAENNEDDDEEDLHNLIFYDND